ncbi:MAG: hypothetical protein ACYC6Y_01735 [Thermoguttaceae bacterium]
MFQSCQSGPWWPRLVGSLLLLLPGLGLFPARSAAAQGQVVPLQYLTQLPARDNGFPYSPPRMQPAQPLEIPDALRIDEPYAWNRTDRYAHPDAQAFFPDDPEGGKQLDDLFGGKLGGSHKPEDLFAAVRRGLRNTKRYPTLILAEIGKGFVWGVKEQDPRAIELLYHASDLPGEAAHSALYHGLTVVKQPGDNLLRTLMDRHATYGAEIQGRILWGLKQYANRDQVTAGLKRLLDEPAGLSDAGIVAALDLYRQFVGQPYGDRSRLEDAGLFAMGFASEGLETADHFRARLVEWAGDEKAVAELVVRIDEGRPVGVAIIRGVGKRDRIVEAIAASGNSELIFSETFSPRVLQQYQLRELARFLPEGLPKYAKPVYAAPPAGEKFAWNATDGYSPPDFFAYFPDDPEGGAALDRMYVDQGRDTQDFTARQVLEAIRRGLRHSKLSKQALMSWVGTVSGWPADPMAREIAYHAADPKADQEIRYNAVYFGLRGWWDKTPNVLRLFAELLASEPNDHSKGTDLRGQILWSVRDNEDEKKYLADHLAGVLEKHAGLPPDRLAVLTGDYRQLTGQKPPTYGRYNARGRFAVLFRYGLANTPEKLRSAAERRFSADPRWVHLAVWDSQNQPQALVVVQGLDGMEWVLAALQNDGFDIDAAVPMADLSSDWVEKLELQKYRKDPAEK